MSYASTEERPHARRKRRSVDGVNSGVCEGLGGGGDEDDEEEDVEADWVEEENVRSPRERIGRMGLVCLFLRRYGRQSECRERDRASS